MGRGAAAEPRPLASACLLVPRERHRLLEQVLEDLLGYLLALGLHLHLGPKRGALLVKDQDRFVEAAILAVQGLRGFASGGSGI